MISYCLYNEYKLIIFNIKYFFYIMLSLTKQLYKNLKLIYKINKIVDLNIFSKIAFITILISNLYIILYNQLLKHII